MITPEAPSDESMICVAVTFQPLSISVVAANVNPSFIDQPLPVFTISSPVKPIEAPPVTVNSAALAETDTNAPAKAVNPTFFKLFILITPYV